MRRSLWSLCRTPTPSAPYDIQTSNWQTKGGTIQPSSVSLVGTYDLGHSYQSFNAMCDMVAGNPPTCQMDGAAGIDCAPNTGTTCPPNPQFNYVDTPPPYGLEHSSMFPCFEHQTMADLVGDWKYYAAGVNSPFTAPNAINHICLPSGGVCTGWGTHVDGKNPARILSDIGSCHFPDLIWVTPSAANSDHAKSNDGGGPSWVASVVNAIGNSTCTDKMRNGTFTYGQDTAILITWDDWGGLVRPRTADHPGGYTRRLSVRISGSHDCGFRLHQPGLRR